MRLVTLSVAIAATLALASTAAFAQTTETQTEEVETTGTSTTTTTTTVTQTTPRILSIALPPNARLRMDVDARDEDLLGVVKSMLRGFKGQSLKELLSSPNFLGKSASAGNGATGATSVDVGQAAAIQLLSDADLETILRDINHMRVVFFEMPYPRSGYSGRSSSRNTNRPAAQSCCPSMNSLYHARRWTPHGSHGLRRSASVGGRFSQARFCVRGAGTGHGLCRTRRRLS
jgi:hypothetical protein